MNTKFFRRKLLTIAIFAFIGLALPLASFGQGKFFSQTVPRDKWPLVNQGASIVPTNTWCSANTGATNTTSPSFFDVVPGCNLVIQFTSYAAGAGTSNNVVTLVGSADGITASSASIASATWANTGTTTNSVIVVVTNNVNARFVGVSSAGSSQTNAVTLLGAQAFWVPQF